MPDPYAPFEPAEVCGRTERPGTQRFRAWVMRQHGGSDLGIVRECDGPEATSLHNEGRAWDWGPELTAGAMFTPSSLLAWRAEVVALLARLETDGDALARAAGLRVIIYDRRQWIAGEGWGDYGGSDPHDTHVHFGLSSAGAAGQTSLYAAPPERLHKSRGAGGGLPLAVLFLGAAWLLLRR